MKKITLLPALILFRALSFAQQTDPVKENQNQERNQELIIVLDDEKIDQDVSILLNEREIHGKTHFDFHAHELAHDAIEIEDFEAKMIDGAFSYNEYAVNYTETTNLDALGS